MKLRATLCITLALALLALTGCDSLPGGQSTPPASAPAASGPAASQFSEEQLRALAFGAVLTARNPMNYDSLPGMAGIFTEAIKEVLVESWDITDRDTAIETLDWLRDEGHHLPVDPEYYSYDEIFQIVTGQVEAQPEELAAFEAEAASCRAVTQALTENYGYTEEELAAVTTVSAWDYDRLVTVARWCYGAEYITEEEAWAYINEAATRGTGDYTSWRTYFAGVMYGRVIWSEDSTFTDGDIADELLEDSSSIYNQVTF